MILVKLGKEGSRITEYALEHGAKWNDLFSKAGFPTVPSFDQFTVNGRMSSIFQNTLLCDKDVIMLKNSKSIDVRVAKIGESLLNVSVTDKDTVRAVLVKAGKLPSFNEEVWVHYDGIVEGKKILLDDIVKNGAILVVEPIKKKSLIKEVEDHLRERYHITSNQLYIEQLINLIKNYR